jgi:hypothetical protein
MQRHLARKKLCENTNSEWPNDKPAEFETHVSRTPRKASVAEELKDIKRLLKSGMQPVTIHNDNSTNVYVNMCVFGQEDLAHLSRDVVVDVIQNMSHEQAFLKIVEMLFFDSSGKNTSFILPPVGHTTALVRKQENTWVPEDVDSVIGHVTKKGVDTLNDMLDGRRYPHLRISHVLEEQMGEDDFNKFEDYCSELLNTTNPALKDDGTINDRKNLYTKVHHHILQLQANMVIHQRAKPDTG